ncbi:MAG TPA: iron ABC transporter permease [Candidatus Binatia bacterium]|jgi:iron(III) transport system permease protein|nr:iron ABC transporter permease [Candidatus Binatia bacterium]
MVSRFNSQSLILVGCTLFVLYLAGIPLVMLLYGSIRSAPIGEPGATYTIQNYVKAYFDREFYLLLLNSVYYAIGTCTLTFLIGTFLAWVSERTNTPFKKLFVVMSLIPFIIPGILSTISWILLLSPKIGLINIVVKELLRLESAPFNVYSMWGMIFAEAIHLYPLVFLLMSAAFRNMDTSLEEAALTAGSSTFQTFFKVTLPLMRPAMVSVLLINFIRGIEAFEVPALIGVPAKISVFTTKIFLAIHQFPSDFGLAGAYAVTLLAISTIGVLIYGRITRKEDRYATVTGKGYRPRVIDLGNWKYVTLGISFLIFFLAVILPVFVLLWSSFIPYYGVPSRELAAKMTLANYQYIINYPLAWTAFKNSFYLSVGSATLVMLLTSVIAWITVKTKLPGREFLDTVTFIPIAMPGIVLGVSLIWVYLTLPIPIYGTIWVLLLAYITKFMPYGIRAASASMIQINKELEEASLTAGGTWFQTFRKVVLPLLMPGFTAGWIYISIIALRELSTSILLYSYNSTVLSIMAFDLWEGGQYTYVCALGVLMVLLLVAMAFTARKLGAKVGIAE